MSAMPLKRVSSTRPGGVSPRMFSTMSFDQKLIAATEAVPFKKSLREELIWIQIKDKDE